MKLYNWKFINDNKVIFTVIAVDREQAARICKNIFKEKSVFLQIKRGKQL